MANRQVTIARPKHHDGLHSVNRPKEDDDRKGVTAGRAQDENVGKMFEFLVSVLDFFFEVAASPEEHNLQVARHDHNAECDQSNDPRPIGRPIRRPQAVRTRHVLAIVSKKVVIRKRKTGSGRSLASICLDARERKQQQKQELPAFLSQHCAGSEASLGLRWILRHHFLPPGRIVVRKRRLMSPVIGAHICPRCTVTKNVW